LETLYERYPHKANVLVNKKVLNVHLSGKGVSVVTEDGSAYGGDLVVGADGIHSRIRSEMWRLADENHPGLITSQDKQGLSRSECLGFTVLKLSTAFTVEYACVFGISEQLPSLRAGEHINSYSNGLCVITFHGEKGRIFWFLLVKLQEKTTYPNTPRFSASDAASLCNKFARFRVSEDVCVSDLWMHKLCASMTALEEGILERWHYDRIVLLGDSVHKVSSSFQPRDVTGVNNPNR
jgi:FAD dependent monooxygenase